MKGARRETTFIDDAVTASLYPNIERTDHSQSREVWQERNFPNTLKKSDKSLAKNKEVKTLTWPSLSLSWDPVETLWCVFKQKVEQTKSPPAESI